MLTPKSSTLFVLSCFFCLVVVSSCGHDPLGSGAEEDAATALDTTGAGDIDTLDTQGTTDWAQGDSVGGCVDTDGDGYGEGCELGFDCNDNAASVNPGAEELCDTIDNNCDGDIDEDLQLQFYLDADGDGFGNDNEIKRKEK